MPIRRRKPTPVTDEPGSVVDAAAPTSSPSLGRSVLTSSVANLMAPLAAFATAPILAYSLGVEGRGEVAAATAPFLLATVIATLGVPEALTFFIARNPRSARSTAVSASWLLLIAGLVSGVGVWLSASLLSDGRLEIQEMIQLSGFAVLPTLLVGGLRGIAAGRGYWNTITAERLIGALFRLIPIAILAVVGELTPFTAFLVIALSPVLGAVVYVRVLRTSPGDVAAQTRVDHGVRLREMFSFGMRVWVGSISGVLLSRLDQLLMIPQAGTYELGLYAVAVNVSEITLVLSSAVGTVIFATDARDRDDARVGAASRITTLLAFVIALSIGVTMPIWVPILFGEDFAAAIPSAAILLLAIVVGSPGSVAGAVLAARGHPGARSLALVIASAVNTAVLFLLVPSLGAVGAALATLVGNVVAGGLNLILVRARHGIPLSMFVGLRRSDLATIGRTINNRLPSRFRRQTR